MGDAFIDESGQRSLTQKSSDHFVMGGVVILPGRLEDSGRFLADLRVELGRQPHEQISWKKIKGHSKRVQAAHRVGRATFLRLQTVVVCKRDFEEGKAEMPDEDFAYMYTFRFLLERLSWLAREMGIVLRYTLAQIGEFPLSKLRHYEKRLRKLDTQIAWGYLDPKGGRIDQPNRVEQLQIADILASATAPAFEPDQFGRVHIDYLEQVKPRLYRYSRTSALTSYGLKMHPWNAKSKASHPWLLDWK